MAIEKINIEKFLALAQNNPVIDVRSPGEFNHAQFPGGYSLPLFNDEERKIVGTTYKQQSREAAIKIGLDFFGVKMKKMVEDVESIIGTRQRAISNKTQLPIANCILVHCWRGGMRSAGVAWLLDMYGFKVYTLVGGYKAFRNWVLKQFNKEYKLKILGAYTGSGKTMALKEMEQLGKKVIDLEGIANHKGSAFGGIGEKPQPSQEMFENVLATELYYKTLERDSEEIWLEDESQRIGKLIIPNFFWDKMRESPIHFLDIPFKERLNFIIDTYGKLEKESLINGIVRIQKRLGGLETKNAINFLLEDNIKECFEILLKYYDKLYTKGLHNRKNYEELLNILPCNNVNTNININKLLQKDIQCS